jgi:hypothetical protein
MNPETIAISIVAILAPYLAEIGKSIASNAGKSLWAAVESKLSKKPAGNEILDDFRKNPQDADVQGAFRYQVRKALSEDNEFLADISKLLDVTDSEVISNSYIAELKGSGSIAQGPGASAAGAGGTVKKVG